MRAAGRTLTLGELIDGSEYRGPKWSEYQGIDSNLPIRTDNGATVVSATMSSGEESDGCLVLELDDQGTESWSVLTSLIYEILHARTIAEARTVAKDAAAAIGYDYTSE